jgi:hypothetical protein
MRRVVLGLVVGGVLLGAAACGGTGSPTPGAGTPGVGGAVAPAPGQAATKASCEAIGEVYTKNMGSFASSLSKVPAAGAGAAAARKEAQQKLGAFGSAVLDATKGSGDSQLRTDGKQAAGQLESKAKDAAFFAKIKTTDDVSTVLGPTMKEWLAPVTHHCS